MKVNKIITMVSLAVLSTSCDHFFGKKTDISFIQAPSSTKNTVAYIPIQPVINGLMYPTDVIIGYDQLIYVADSLAGAIVCYDLSGKRLSSFTVSGVSHIAQDRQLDILAIGTFDTIISSVKYSLSTLYRIELKNSSYGFSSAFIKNKIVHPFYYKNIFSPSDATVKLQNIGVMGDNSYYVTRSGVNNSSTQFGGPDNNVLLFDKSDKFITPIEVTTSTGIYSDYFKMPKGITTLAAPPQSNIVSPSGDFIFTSLDPSMTLKVQYIQKISNANGVDYEVKELGTGDTTLADGFLYDPYKFSSPTDVTVTGDGTNYLFVADEGKDSVFQFTVTGLEGVKPPPTASSHKNIKVSFGGTGSELTQFIRPTAVAYFEKILYVADAGNGRVVRFKLTTDIK